MIYLVFLFFLFFYQEEARLGVKNGWDFFITILFPSLFFLLFIAEFLKKEQVTYQIGSFFHPLLRFLIHSPSKIYSGLFISSFFPSSPGSQALEISYLKRGLLKRRNANILLASSFYMNPSFLSIMILKIGGNGWDLIPLYASNVLLAIVLGFFIDKEIDIKPSLEKIEFKKAISSVFFILVNILSITIIMMFFAQIFMLYREISPLFGFVELSIGLSKLKKGQKGLFLILSSFGGLSIHLQVASVIGKECSYLIFFFGRIMNLLLLLPLLFL